MKKDVKKSSYQRIKIVKKTSTDKSTSNIVTKGIKKEYFKSRTTCKVTFRLPKDAAPEARNVVLVGDFNNWNMKETPMKRLKAGDFKLTMELPKDKEYRFRYFIDGRRWENDWCADRYAPNPFGCDDSIVIV